MHQRKDGLAKLPRSLSAVSLARVDEMCRFICQSQPRKSELMAWCKEKWGLTRNSCLKCYTRALAQMREDVALDVAAMRGQAIGVYRAIIADPSAKHRDVIRAQRGIVEILGLAAPQQLQVSAAVLTQQASLGAIPFDRIAAVQHELAGVSQLPAPQLEPMDVQAMIEDAKPINVSPADATAKSLTDEQATKSGVSEVSRDDHAETPAIAPGQAPAS